MPKRLDWCDSTIICRHHNDNAKTSDEYNLISRVGRLKSENQRENYWSNKIVSQKTPQTHTIPCGIYAHGPPQWQFCFTAVKCILAQLFSTIPCYTKPHSIFMMQMINMYEAHARNSITTNICINIYTVIYTAKLYRVISNMFNMPFAWKRRRKKRK